MTVEEYHNFGRVQVKWEEMPCMGGAYAHELEAILGPADGGGDDGGTNQESRWQSVQFNEVISKRFEA